jgi:hypothetical protein
MLMEHPVKCWDGREREKEECLDLPPSNPLINKRRKI